MEKFGVAFGDPQTGRINPCGLDYPAVYLETMPDGSRRVNSTMDAVIDGVLELLKWIDETVGTDDFHHVNIEKAFLGCINKWKEAGHTRLELGEFRLMIIVQICCLIKVGVKGHEDLRSLVYPVANLGAATQLKNVTPGDRPYVLTLITKAAGLGEDEGTNPGEGLLCEMSETRCTHIFDVVLPGQFLFRHGKNGENMLQPYGSDTYVEF